MDDLIPPVSYAPDGLYESDVDALIAEYFTTDIPDGPASTLVDRVSSHRHVRRIDRQAISAAVQSVRLRGWDADTAA
ncbi:hypothetical protein FPZ12_006920 [Amycolatopsis acidicola]|uniref:Uncharacterized protein n=1 Tax=Amycolatopsis acidicola TaxID=2596893 RepID=A0A5N0VFT0_9PSEU|nr:hypothetical protein [Amycolatopsis acidicola]KAA9164975.1 hypothetical protein FPZ12_006920 [Amycolatopsis acidicola]